jgi:hypothetical protein
VNEASCFFRATTAFPPGFGGNMALFVLTMFSCNMMTLLGLEWIWDNAHKSLESPAPRWTGLWYNRVVTSMLVICAMLFAAPTSIYGTYWVDASPLLRASLAFARSICFCVAGMLFVATWLLRVRADYIIQWDMAQLRARPLSRLSGAELRRTLTMILGAAGLAVAACAYSIVRNGGI